MAECVGHVPCYNMCYSDVCTVYRGANGVWDYTTDGEDTQGGLDDSGTPTGTYVPYNCPANTSNFPDDGVEDLVHEEVLESMGRSINDEYARRVHYQPSLTTITFPDLTGSEQAGTDIIEGNGGATEFMVQIRDAINAIGIGTLSFTAGVGTKVKYSDILAAKNLLDTARATCVCDTWCSPNTTCVCYEDCSCFGY